MDEIPIWKNAEGDYDWFDQVYRSARGYVNEIPWARGEPNRMLQTWLQENPHSGAGAAALVVGCGLGDDAEALAQAGYSVTAFDISQRAIEWCKQRFPQSSVNYKVADLFNLPGEWVGKFDLVFEASTLQALPRHLLVKAMTAIAETKADEGQILVIAFGRDEGVPLSSEPPWPLLKEELDYFQKLGLQEKERVTVSVNKGARPGYRHRITYQ